MLQTRLLGSDTANLGPLAMVLPMASSVIGSVRTALIEIPAARIVFATDYPQEIRAREAVRDFVRDVRASGRTGSGYCRAMWGCC